MICIAAGAVAAAALFVVAFSTSTLAGGLGNGSVDGNKRDARPVRENRVEQDLQTVALQVMISPMFASQNGNGMFGSGTAGRHWQALLSENVARTLVASGRVQLLPKSREFGMKTVKRPDPVRRVVPQSAPCGLAECTAMGEWRTTVVRSHEQRRTSGPMVGVPQ